MNSIAIIPARGGSRRVPRKNIRDFYGKPALVYTVEAALQSNIFSEIVVSTDDEEIASTAQQSSGVIAFNRAAELADDNTPVSKVTLDVLQKRDPDGTLFDAVAQLMPNCPLRTSEDVIASYQDFINSDADIQISVSRFNWLNPWWALQLDSQNRIEPLFKERMLERSQDLPTLFCPTGAIWWAKTKEFRKAETFHIPGRTAWEIPWYRSVDIDTESDWILAELLFKAKKTVSTIDE